MPHDSPNRTCGFPAPGSRVGSCASHTEHPFEDGSDAGPRVLRGPSFQKLYGFTRVAPLRRAVRPVHAQTASRLLAPRAGRWIRGLARFPGGLSTLASPCSTGGAMIGREKRVLVRHDLEQSMLKAPIARQVAAWREHWMRPRERLGRAGRRPTVHGNVTACGSRPCHQLHPYPSGGWTSCGVSRSSSTMASSFSPSAVSCRLSGSRSSQRL